LQPGNKLFDQLDGALALHEHLHRPHVHGRHVGRELFGRHLLEGFHGDAE
jgi:hypothetical protein